MRQTIMCTELLPTSIAAMRIRYVVVTPDGA